MVIQIVYGLSLIHIFLTSFDVWAAELPRIEIYGTKGTMSVPDPNCFGGPVKIFTEAEPVWKEYPLTHGYAEQSRGIGAADICLLYTSRIHCDTLVQSAQLL